MAIQGNEGLCYGVKEAWCLLHNIGCTTQTVPCSSMASADLPYPLAPGSGTAGQVLGLPDWRAVRMPPPCKVQICLHFLQVCGDLNLRF